MKKLFFGEKQAEYYKGFLIKADLGLHEQIAEKIQSEVTPGGKILDLGAGEGALSARLSDLGFLVTAADKDQENFKCPQVNFSRINFDSPEEIAQFVAEHEGEFDAVLGIEVIEHVQDQWQYVRQLMKMSKNGGLVLITTPNTTSWISRLLFFFTGRFHQFADGDLSYGHINPVSPWELDLMLNMLGAKKINISPAGTLPPIYITGLNKLTILNLLILPVRFVMSGILDGWCVMATARKVK
jgi:cyclopropane fatty-acyl-phospholipid synthase-like methyltransferase